MSLKTLFLIQAVAFGLIGLGMLFVPQQLMSVYGVELNASGIGLARLYGATSLTAAIIYWLGGSAAQSEARRALMLGGLIGNVIAAIVGVINIISGSYGSMLWASVVLWLLFALGYAYYLFIKKDAA